MTIKTADIRPEEEEQPEPQPRAPPPEPDFPWGAVLAAAAVGAILGAGITALVLLGRAPGAETVGDPTTTTPAGPAGRIAVDTVAAALTEGFPWG